VEAGTQSGLSPTDARWKLPASPKYEIIRQSHFPNAAEIGITDLGYLTASYPGASALSGEDLAEAEAVL
jgi:hypothetical protein